ncbi:general stress protein [Staphylococcus xylosus]|uniref:general stress protein n=1 Tax=Staphylococcus xylosus TaxID=1288 RepID=UPI001C1DDBF8|nr:general stress protein [Staphylococcus xylosus]MBU6132967.1 general stress protein [Staphylococcus xylosus]MDG5479527.1 general stress protein [Staphylococcus xylosus]MEB7384468.1 general stress protein [Staphylococcus xylosus]MEB7831108.1 general stress protein [Staphylococcus xylosus]MEB8150789.1 general stress protein [Staphylococcus xylosus]
MSEFTIIQKSEELIDAVKNKIAEGYRESEISVISKTKLHIDELHDSEVNLTATSGSFSDKMAKILTGEDGEEVVLAYYKLSDAEMERYKKEILDGNYLVVATKDESSHEEVENANAAYENETVVQHHYAEESKGPKS